MILKTCDTVIEFAIIDGNPVISRVQATNGSHNWAMGTPETALPTCFESLGHARTVTWRYVGASISDGRVEFAYVSDSPEVELVSIWESTDLPGPIEHTVVLTNRHEHKVLLNPVPTVCVRLHPQQEHALQNWWVEKGAGYVSDQGVHIDVVTDNYTKTLISGTYSLEGLRREAVPWFSLHDNDTKHGIYGGIEFSGWTKTLIRKLSDGSVSVELGLHDRDGMTTHQMHPGESLELPTSFIGAYVGEVEDGCNRLHRWTEKHLMPPAPGGVTPVLVNNSWGSGMAVTEDLAKRMIDDCEKLGIELFHVDAGWYREVGDWHTDPEKLPGSLEKISDYAHSKGLKFGLWVGWTQGGSKRNGGDEALSVFNPKQRQWFGSDYPEDWKAWDFTGQTVCLGSKDARDWCLKELRRVVKQYRLDLLEHDQAMMIDHCIRGSHGHRRDDPVDVSRSTAEGYYWVYDQLRAEFPNLLLENCVNGGRIVDFGIAKRTHYVCSTDVYDPLSLRRTFYDMSYPLPPRSIELYIEQQKYESLEHFRFVIRSSMLGWCTIMIDTTTWDSAQHEAARRDFTIYKEKLRPLIAHANVYHVLPRPDGKRWDGIQYHDPETGNGALMVFRPDSHETTRSVVLCGLDTDATYSVSSVDGSVSERTVGGDELMATGLTVYLPEKNSSDIVFVSL